MKDKSKITIVPDEELKIELEKIAKADNRSLNSLICDIILRGYLLAYRKTLQDPEFKKKLEDASKFFAVKENDM